MALLSRLCQRNNPPRLLLHKSSLGLLSSSSSSSQQYHSLSSPHLVQARSSAANITSLLSFCRPELRSRGFAAAAAVRSTSPASAPQTVEQEKANENTVLAAADSDNSPRKRGGGRRRSSLWRNPRAIVPYIGGGGGGLLTPMSGIGNALWQTRESINRLLRNIPSPAHFFRRWKEDDSAYKLQLEVPGLSKDDLKVTVEDNVLVIAGQKKGEVEESRGAWDGDEEEEEEGGYYHWSSRSYGYYNTSLMLPEDAKADEIKAEVKHGVLYVTIPRTGEKIKRDVREVEVQ